MGEPEKIRIEDGMECELYVHGFKAKKRTMWKPTFPDLYYILRINGEKVSDSKKNVRENKITADWKISFPNQLFRSRRHLTVEDRIEVEFWDEDSGILNEDDLIGSKEFRASK